LRVVPLLDGGKEGVEVDMHDEAGHGAEKASDLPGLRFTPRRLSISPGSMTSAKGAPLEMWQDDPTGFQSPRCGLRRGGG
jgi:hypothetical protein